MTRKYLNLTIACLLVVFMMAGCTTGETGTTPTETTIHTHVAGAEWEWNGTEHWHLCACGEKIDAAAHNVDGEIVCTDCGVEVMDFGDGYVDIISYDEYGQIASWISFGPDGEVLNASVYEHVYDENGNMLTEKHYENDILADETEYAVSEDGENYPVQTVYYQENGESFINEYDAAGNVIKLVDYGADGSVLFEQTDEYALNADGEYYNIKSTQLYEDGELLIAVHNEYGDIISREIYDAAGNLTSEEVWEYEYNDEGKPMWVKQYRDGELVFEIAGYIEGSDGYGWWRFPETIIEYHGDGTKTVSIYDENDDLVSEITYDADGNEIP